jgi:hypothetical protein
MEVGHLLDRINLFSFLFHEAESYIWFELRFSSFGPGTKLDSYWKDTGPLFQ